MMAQDLTMVSCFKAVISEIVELNQRFPNFRDMKQGQSFHQM